MQPLCHVCAHPLEPYGSGGMTCAMGHHFTTAEVTHEIPLAVAVKVAGRTLAVRHAMRPWLPGVVLGGLALAGVLVEAVT